MAHFPEEIVVVQIDRCKRVMKKLTGFKNGRKIQFGYLRKKDD
jgi:hypothetical protein